MGIALANSASPPRGLESVRRSFFRAFFPLLLGAIALSEWVVVARLVSRLGFPAPAVLHLLGPLGFFMANRALILRLRRRSGGALTATYTAFAFTCVFAGAFLGIAEIVWAAARVVTIPAVGAGLLAYGDVTRWQPAFEAVVDAGIAGIGALFAFGYTFGRRALDVTSLRVAVPGLPAELAGFRIVHLSDLHIGRYLGLTELREHVERVNGLEPDLICITGDLVDRAETCAHGFPVLAGLRARHGVLVTLGNHDFYAGADTVTAALRETTPFTVLRNARADIGIDGARLAVIGVDDLGRDWARGVLEHPALPPLVRTVPAGMPLVVMTHRPDCFDQAADLGASVVLAGHTHGGQLALPALLGRRVRNLAEFITRYDRGVFRRGDATLVVSNGLGFTGQRVRLFTPREIGCIELFPA